MLQWLYTYVASVCSKCFIYFFRRMFASVFIWMLHVFHTYVTCILSGCCIYFAMVFQVFLQVFQMYVANVSTVLNLCCKYFIQMFRKQIGCCIFLLVFLLLAQVSPPLLDAGDVRAAWARVGAWGMGWVSRSSGVESEWAGCAARSRRGELRLDAGLGQDTRALA